MKVVTSAVVDNRWMVMLADGTVHMYDPLCNMWVQKSTLDAVGNPMHNMLSLLIKLGVKIK